MERWLGKLGRTAYKLRKWIVAVWLIVLLGLSVFAVQLRVCSKETALR